MDYIHFCFLRDRNKTTLDEFEVLTCDVCMDGKKHTKFTCPKLHFIPLKNMVIHKGMRKEKTLKTPRVTDRYRRIQLKKCNALEYYLEICSLLKSIVFQTEKAGCSRVIRMVNLSASQFYQTKQLNDSHF
jgi:hypothetical protein